MPGMYAKTSTNTLSTEDWLRATQNMQLPAESSKSEQLLSSENQASARYPIFGTHIKEAVAIVKDWIEDTRK